MDTTTTGSNWLDVLRTGISGIVDAQVAKSYNVNQPVYNTAGGTGGQSQTTTAKQESNNVMLYVIAGGVALLAAVLLLRRK